MSGAEKLIGVELWDKPGKGVVGPGSTLVSACIFVVERRRQGRGGGDSSWTGLQGLISSVSSGEVSRPSPLFSVRVPAL